MIGNREQSIGTGAGSSPARVKSFGLTGGKRPMAYRCEKCGHEWSDQLATENEFYCTRRCGGTLVRLETTPVETGAAAALAPHDHLPYPAAIAVERFRAAIVGGNSAWDR